MATRTQRRSRIGHFKAPFVVAVAALGAGCGARAEQAEEPALTNDETQTSSTSTSHTSSEGTTHADGCPEQKPVLGSACDGAAQLCRYEPGSCTPSVSCSDGIWTQQWAGSCNPPWFGGATCPEQEPTIGSSCTSYRPGVSCDYPFCYGTAPLARCNADTLRWEAIPVPSCNPPALFCPAEMPTHGADCSNEGQSCYYDGCQGTATDPAVCTFGQWSVQYVPGPACNPPAFLTPVCPTIEPEPGNGCAFQGQQCDYGICGAIENPPRILSCSAGSWQQLEAACPGSADAGVDGGG